MGIIAIGLGRTETPYREKGVLVVPSGSQLPRNCVKCGVNITSKPVTKTFRWHPRWLWLLIFVGLIFYVIVVLVVQKKVQLEVPFCEAHRLWRTRMNTLGAALFLGSIIISVALDALGVHGGLVALILVSGVVSGIAVLVTVSSSFRPIYVGDGYSKFTGAGEDFLSLLPTSPVSSN